MPCKTASSEDTADFPELPDELLNTVLWPKHTMESDWEPVEQSVPAKRKAPPSNEQGRERVEISGAEPADSGDTLEPETETAADTTFLDFCQRLQRKPGQVLRCATMTCH